MMHEPEDFENFVNFRVTGEKWLARAHLREDGTDGPHVDASGVLTTAEQNLRGTVPECNNLNEVNHQAGLTVHVRQWRRITSWV